MKKILSLLALAMMSIVSVYAENVVFGFSDSDFPLTAGTSFDVEDTEGETVVTLTVGFAGGADFKFKGNAALKDAYGFTGFTEGNGENGTATSGTTYIIKPLYDGQVTVGIVLNAGKKFYVLESEQAMDGYDGMTVDAKVTGGTYSFPVKAGRTYKVFCTGSKLGFYGFAYTYDPSKVQTDVDVIVTDEVKIGDDIYMTFSCDKALDFSAVEGLTAYSVKKKITGDIFSGMKAGTELTEVTNVPAGAGVLLKAAAAGKYVVPFAKGSVAGLTDNDLKVVEARTALADMQTVSYGEVQKGPGILGTKTFSYFDYASFSSKEVTVTGFVMLDEGEKEFLEAGTVYMDFDCDFDKGGAESELNYPAYTIGMPSSEEETAVELNSIAELKAHNDNGLVKLNLFSAKVTYSDGNNYAVVEDYSGATVVDGLGKLVATGDDLYGSLDLHFVVVQNGHHVFSQGRKLPLRQRRGRHIADTRFQCYPAIQHYAGTEVDVSDDVAGNPSFPGNAELDTYLADSRSVGPIHPVHVRTQQRGLVRVHDDFALGAVHVQALHVSHPHAGSDLLEQFIHIVIGQIILDRLEHRSHLRAFLLCHIFLRQWYMGPGILTLSHLSVASSVGRLQ